MEMRFYILDVDGKTPVGTDDIHVWATFKTNYGRCQKRETVAEGIDVSTVFLGIDHSYVKGGPPILWETMIFGGKHDQYQDRYATYDEAMIGHEKAKRIALGLLEPTNEGV